MYWPQPTGYKQLGLSGGCRPPSALWSSARSVRPQAKAKSRAAHHQGARLTHSEKHLREEEARVQCAGTAWVREPPAGRKETRRDGHRDMGQRKISLPKAVTSINRKHTWPCEPDHNLSKGSEYLHEAAREERTKGLTQFTPRLYL